MHLSNLELMAGRTMCFGELLLRISPDRDGQWLQANLLPAYLGGAEANVAVALARWGLPVSYFTAMPNNAITTQLMAYLTSLNVDVSKTLLDGKRLGLFYLGSGNDMKSTGVVYDRADSSFCQLKPQAIDWDEKLRGINWLHLSAISPALSPSAAAVCEEALMAANQKKIRISIDLNYRARLWQYGVQPVDIMPQLVKYCDVIMGNLWAIEKMLGIPLDPILNNGADKDKFVNAAEETGNRIFEIFPKCHSIAQTFRFDRAVNSLTYYATLHTRCGQFNLSKEYMTDHIVDRVGSGDCFMAGLIYGFQNRLNNMQILDFATAAAFKKLFVPGDFTTSSIQDINLLIKANAI